MDGSWTLEPSEEICAPAPMQAPQVEPTWTEERIEQLTRLWEEGVTTAEIGRRIGVSKNAVIGKVHRIGLVPRVVKELPPPKRNVFEFTGPACMWPSRGWWARWRSRRRMCGPITCTSASRRRACA